MSNVSPSTPEDGEPPWQLTALTTPPLRAREAALPGRPRHRLGHRSGQGPAIVPDDIAGDGQAQARPTLVATAGLVQPDETLFWRCAHSGPDPRPDRRRPQRESQPPRDAVRLRCLSVHTAASGARHRMHSVADFSSAVRSGLLRAAHLLVALAQRVRAAGIVPVGVAVHSGAGPVGRRGEGTLEAKQPLGSEIEGLHVRAGLLQGPQHRQVERPPGARCPDPGGRARSWRRCPGTG